MGSVDHWLHTPTGYAVAPWQPSDAIRIERAALQGRLV